MIRDKLQNIQIQKWDSTTETKQFLLMFLITYLITIAMSTFISLNTVDKIIVKESLKPKDFLDMFKLVDGRLDFYNCEKIDTILYFSAKLIETIVPTTITFCGTILVLQFMIRQNKAKNSLLFCFLVILSLLGVSITTVNTVFLLNLYLILIVIVFAICVVFSRKIYYFVESEQETLITHKNENSDGKLIRN